MGHFTIGVAEGGVAYDGVVDCGHRGYALLTICVTDHGTKDDDIVNNDPLNRQRNKITLTFSTLKTNDQF